MYAPLLPFVTEEIYQCIFKDSEGISSIHKTSWPKEEKAWDIKEENLRQAEVFIQSIDDARKEKAARGLKFKDAMADYAIRGDLDRELFGHKLQKMFNITNFTEL